MRQAQVTRNATKRNHVSTSQYVAERVASGMETLTDLVCRRCAKQGRIVELSRSMGSSFRPVASLGADDTENEPRRQLKTPTTMYKQQQSVQFVLT